MQGLPSDLAALFGMTLLIASLYWIAKMALLSLEQVLWTRRQKHRAIEACSCPRAPEERLLAPTCAVARRSGADRDEFFTAHPPPPGCKYAIALESGHLCTCKHRARVFLAYGI